MFMVAFLTVSIPGFVCCISTVAADRLQPQIPWFQLETEHFVIIAEEPLRAQIPNLAAECEQAYSQLSPLLNWRFKEKPTVLFSDGNDLHNGWATSISHPTLFIYATPSRNNSYLAGPCNHRRRTVYHELTHLLQTDACYGLIAACNSLFGRIWTHSLDPLTLVLGVLTLPPVNATPSWYKEGTAIWAESQFAGPGRGQSAVVDAIFRTMVDQNRLISPVKWHLRNPCWPYGTSAYLYGMKAIEDAARYPDEKTPANPDFPGQLGDATAHAPLAGWFNSQALQVGNRDFVTIAEDTLKHETENQINRITRLQTVPMTRLIRHSPATVQVTEPVWTPDGNLWVVAAYTDQRARLARIDLEQATLDPLGPLVTEGWTQTAADPISGDIYFTRLDGYAGSKWRSFLYRFSPKTNKTVKIEQIDRVMDVTVTREGNLFVVRRIPSGDLIQDWCWNDSQQQTIIPVTFMASRDICKLDSQTVLSSPVSFSESTRVWLQNTSEASKIMYRNSTQPETVLYNSPGNATCRNLTVNPQGRLMTTADLNGVFNLYEYSSDSLGWQPVTHTLGGVYDCQYSPDGNRAALIGLDADGYFVSVVDSSVLQPISVPLPCLPSPWRLAAETPTQTSYTAHGMPEQILPYNPLSHLRMDYWAPWLNVASGYVTGGLATQWTDRSLSHTLFAKIGLESDHDALIGNLNWSYNALRPALEATIQRQVPLYSGLMEDRLGRWFDLEETRWSSVLAARWDWKQSDFNAVVRTGWAGVHRSVMDKTSWQTAWQNGRFQWEPMLDGLESSLWITSEINTATAFRSSISLEDGVMARISLDGAHQIMGSDLDRLRVRLDLGGWWHVPVSDNHVAKFSASWGASWGDEIAQGAFTVGGYDSLAGGNPPGMQSAMTLRGYQGNVQVGNQAARLALAYRFPLMKFYRSLTPRSIHYTTQLMAETFFETATAWDDNHQRDWYQSMGLELNVGSIWFSSIDFSPGVGFCWMPDFREKNSLSDDVGDWSIYFSVKTTINY